MKLTACRAIHDCMPKPRKRLVSLSDTPYYHCISRGVRRAFLCGIDRQSGYRLEHRRQWIVERSIEPMVPYWYYGTCLPKSEH